jgi:hypothetical protein
MNFSPRSRRPRPKSRNSFRRTLLRRPLHKLSAAMPVSTCVPYHLRDFIKTPQKSPFVSYHLQTLKPVTTCVPYHLQKTPGWGAQRNVARVPRTRGFTQSGKPRVQGNPSYNFLRIAETPGTLMRPCVTPLDSIASRPCVKRPCLSPLESHSYKKIGGGG